MGNDYECGHCHRELTFAEVQYGDSLCDECLSEINEE